MPSSTTPLLPLLPVGTGAQWLSLASGNSFRLGTVACSSAVAIWAQAAPRLPVPPGSCGLNAWPLQRREIIPKPRPCVCPVASEALIPWLWILMSGLGLEGWASGEEEEWQRESHWWVSVAGKAAVSIWHSPRRISDHSGGFRFIHSLRVQASRGDELRPSEFPESGVLSL